MQNVDQHHNVELVIAERDSVAIELLDGNVGLIPNKHVDALDRKILALSEQEVCDEAIPRAHIQDSGGSWEQLPKMPAKDARAPVSNV
jgi:hypothetical protein